MKRLLLLASLLLVAGCGSPRVSPSASTPATAPERTATERMIACSTVIDLGAVLVGRGGGLLGAAAAARTKKGFWGPQMSFYRWEELSAADREKLTRASGTCTDWDYGLVMEYPEGTKPLGQILDKALAPRQGLKDGDFFDYTTTEWKKAQP